MNCSATARESCERCSTSSTSTIPRTSHTSTWRGWATHRDHAGLGLGTRLIRENLAEIDARSLPAFLESTNPANLPRYEGLGFVRRSEFGPPGGPVITTMWRNAASSG